MSDTPTEEEQLAALRATCAALAAFIVDMPEARRIEMPRIKARIKADTSLTEAQQALAIDAAREIKHAIAARDDGGH
jgi:hypothetical protein